MVSVRNEVVMTMGLAFVEDEMLTLSGLPPPVHVALPIDVGSGEAMTRISSPAAIRARVAPLVRVFHRVAKLVPALASLPPSKST